MKPEFTAGRNIAMKVPVHEFQSTVAFYRDVLGLKTIGEPQPGAGDSPRFEFGDKVLWIDAVPGISQAEIWLEVVTDDIERAAAHFEAHRCARRDEIEPLPAGMAAFWISSPANIIHLVSTPDSA